MSFRKIFELREKKYFLGHMIRFQNESAIYAIDSALLANHLILELPTAWYEIILEDPLNGEMAQNWISLNGNWKHGSGNSRSHNQLGMADALPLGDARI